MTRAGGACAPSGLFRSKREGEHSTSLREQCLNHIWRLFPPPHTQTGSFPNCLWSWDEVNSNAFSRVCNSRVFFLAWHWHFPTVVVFFTESASRGREGETGREEADRKDRAPSRTRVFCCCRGQEGSSPLGSARKPQRATGRLTCAMEKKPQHLHVADFNGNG